MKSEEIIHLQRDGLRAVLEPRLERLARRCAATWQRQATLDGVLQRGLEHLPHCHLLYALDAAGRQRSANVTPNGADRTRRGQLLAGRPFLEGAAGSEPFVLSPVYVCQITSRSCLTAVHEVVRGGELLGWVAADFDLLDLPLVHTTAEPVADWCQISGDPVIRERLFLESRQPSRLDPHLDTVSAIMAELVRDRGVFHAKLHYSACRASLWLTDDPYRYRVHMQDQVLDPALLLAYPRRSFPVDAVMDPEMVDQVWRRFAHLRLADPHVYLRSASLNVINGLVGLNFSCDGYHYLSAAEFIGGRDTWSG